MLLGFLGTLDWIQEARSLGKKAIISSTFESMVGLKILANLSLLTEQIPGLGTDRWLKGEHLFNSKGIALKESLI
jgi:O-succinylbenzoate synthase